MRVKICGLTTVAAVEAAVDAGATAIGFVFADSPRQVTPQAARVLVDAVPRGIEAIAVFRKTIDAALLSAVLDLGVEGVQAEVEPVGLPRSGVFYVRSVPDGPNLLARLGQPGKATLVSGSFRGAVLVDAAGGGGLGVAADWDRVADASAMHALVLAGGLTPGNVAEAIRRVRPIGVDVSSGVERSRGVKDTGLIRAFIQAANP